jgi:DNA polymerase V
VAEKLRERALVPSWLSIELRPSRHGDFAYRRGSITVSVLEPTNNTTELLKVALRGVDALFESRVPYKKAGVTAGGLIPESYVQPMLLGAAPGIAPGKVLDTVADSINDRFGAGTIRPAIILDNRLKSSAALRSPSYTTAWKDIPRVQA